jgi:predicted cobalt transporter CbtA
VVCQDCGNENATMNRTCAYCGTRFPRLSMTTLRARRGPSDALKWMVFAAAVVVPLIGLVPGLAYARNADRAHRSVARLWLITGACSALVYLVVFLI